MKENQNKKTKEIRKTDLVARNIIIETKTTIDGVDRQVTFALDDICNSINWLTQQSAKTNGVIQTSLLLVSKKRMLCRTARMQHKV